MKAFHADDYVDFLQNINPDNLVRLLLALRCAWADSAGLAVPVPVPRPLPVRPPPSRRGLPRPAPGPCPLLSTLSCAPSLPTPPQLPAAFHPPLPVSPLLQSQFTRELREYNMYEDCPVFSGLYEYCQVLPRYRRHASLPMLLRGGPALPLSLARAVPPRSASPAVLPSCPAASSPAHHTLPSLLCPLVE